MTGSTLIKKLNLRPGMSALVLNPPEGYIDSLGELPEGVRVNHQPAGMHDFVQLFVQDSAQFKDLSPAALESVVYDGLMWVCYPKKSSKVESDLSRELVWELMQGSGLRPVTQVSIDATWSALRFRPVEKVGK